MKSGKSTLQTFGYIKIHIRGINLPILSFYSVAKSVHIFGLDCKKKTVDLQVHTPFSAQMAWKQLERRSV
jgi:hypothetical protein